MKETAGMAKNINKEGIPCPIIFYTHGVQLNDNGGNNVKPVMRTIFLNQPNKMLQQHIFYLTTFKQK